MSKATIKELCEMAMLIALNVVFTRVAALNTAFSKIGIGFLFTLFCSMSYGIVWGGVCAGAADIIGAVLFPTGALNPAFTATAIIAGCVSGVFLHRKKPGFGFIVACAVFYAIIYSWLINTGLIAAFYGGGYAARLITRLPQCIVLLLLQLLLLPPLVKVRDRMIEIGLLHDIP